MQKARKVMTLFKRHSSFAIDMVEALNNDVILCLKND